MQMQPKMMKMIKMAHINVNKSVFGIKSLLNRFLDIYRI